VPVLTPAKARALGLPPQMVGTLWNPATPQDVRDEQARVRAAFTGLNTALATSPPQGDAATVNLAVSQYNAFSKKVSDYLASDPAILWWNRDAQVSDGQNYEAQIESWRQKFASMSVAVPAAPPAPPASHDPLDFLGNINDTIKWVVLGYLAIKLLGK
jgi:hypothetical protein